MTKKSIIFAAALVALTSIAKADQSYDNPKITVSGQDYALVGTLADGTMSMTAFGACVLRGWTFSDGTAQQNGLPGPFAVLDPSGQVTQTFPDTAENRAALSVITTLYCDKF